MVPNTYSAGDEGKVVSNGALVAQSSQSIDTNGTYDTTLKNSVTVNVSGGGSFTPTYAAIRPDAELVNSYSYDQLAVQDLGITIPAYQTSYFQLVATNKVMDGVVIDVDNYDYFVHISALVYPIKSQIVHEAGAFEYHFMNQISNIRYIPAGKIKSFDGTKSVSSANGDPEIRTYGANVYNASASAISTSDTTSASSLTNGIYTAGTTVSFTKSSKKLSITAPAFRMTGHSTQFNQTDWERVTDIRMQYKINVYRVPKSNNRLDGWELNMALENTFASIANGGTLT
ncbi:MAG: hypothetical protein IJ821_07320 [Lachnospiraceae bacterium]|nr:hypothetical protein [Lachnospiraceae bacterium]